MADRITWQNVAAPDLRVALAGSVAAADQLAKGFSNLGTTFKGVNDQNITDESNAAMMEAMKIQDPDAWNQMMATTGIAGLGVGPGRASAELMQFAEGYGANLDARRAAVDATNAAADTSRAADQRFDMNVTANDRLLVTNAQADRASDFDYNTAVTAADRLVVTDKQDDTDFNRTVTLSGRADDIYNKSLDDEARRLESDIVAQKIMRMNNPALVKKIWEEQGAAGFGIDPSRATPELTALMAGRDEQLVAEADAIYDKERNRTADQLTDLNLAKDQASEKANLVLEALTPADAAEVQAMTANGTIWKFLGISPDMVTPEFQAKVFGYADSLTAEGRTDTTNTLAFDATLRTEEDRKLNDKAAQIVADLNNGTIRSADDLAIAVNNWSQTNGNDPKMAKFLQENLAKVDPAQFAATETATAAAQSTPEYLAASQALASRRNLFQYNNSRNALITAYSAGVEDFGSGGTGGSVIDALVDQVMATTPEKTEDGAENPKYNENAATTRQLFNDLKAANSKVPDAAIASLMKQLMQGDGFVFAGDQLEFARTEIRKNLAEMSTDDAIRGFEQEKTRIDNAVNGFASQQAAMDRLVKEMAVADSQGQRGAYNKALAELTAITGTMEPPAKKDPPPVVLNESGNVVGGTIEANNNPVLPPGSVSQTGGVRNYDDMGSFNPTFDNALNTAAGLPLGTDSRARGSNSDVRDFVNRVTTGAQIAAQDLDYAAGNISASALEGMDWLNEKVALGVGAVDPVTGSSMLRAIENNPANTAGLREQGFVADETGTPERSQEVTEAAAEFADMAALAEIDLSENSRTRTALEVLISGMDPNGNPLSDVQRAKATEVLLQAVNASGSKFVSRKEKDAAVAKLLAAANVSRQ